ncbi:geranylgeranylglyceryl/heptaprenylglyceryl phosphate synthase [Mangrovimonas xylaniphaga]|uniref:geranylgeranylglyceryl/heptaprenylglyceryl phosphate synthase n=1 Tax=Mangrovimonas xylaniphaga TaxID=1645915 RepID=UPI0006B69A9C|nr:geranylgeranylglyceryl/heptaprenylglyceryl phosphate synthase [Mangrovimonas xylaniphaga]
MIYKDILIRSAAGERLLAVLLDPDKLQMDRVVNLMEKINKSIATHIFVGGSEVDEHVTPILVAEIKKYTLLPVIIFPGDVCQISEQADALLFLSLISGRNPEYLIGKQVQAVQKLREANLEIIPTGYLLIENGKETAVQRVTHTLPMSKDNVQNIVDTAKAGELLGMKLIYLEAGSGAMHPIGADIIKKVKEDLRIPLIVGGGIRNMDALGQAYNAGADMVVIGTAFEQDETFFDRLQQKETILETPKPLNGFG